MKLKQNYHFCILILIIILVGCSAERNNIISKTYHNTTARFNAYFYAKQQIEGIEDILEENSENNYGRILRIYPPLDSTLAVSYQEKVDEIIKMAGIAIDIHKNSKWVDDSWILAGRARYYDLDFENAIETFKFVNKNSKDPKARHEALIRLIHTFTDYKEYRNANAVSDYLDKEDLNKRNLKLLYLTRAHHYQMQDDLDMMLQNLVKVAPLLKKREGKARIYFIIGQVYQKLGFEAEAYNYYRKCVASNPEYELDFHARLNMAQVTQLKNTSDLKSARKVFEKLLKDKKNKEFKDKIYYEWARFEAKQNNIDMALEYYKTAANLSQSERQRGLAYFQQATIYYDSLHNYRMAQAYYDSTATTLPRDEEVDFLTIDKRNKVLGDFVKNLITIERNDSLLSLVSMDSVDLMVLLQNKVEAQKEAAEKLAEESREKARVNATSRASVFMDENTTVASNWYFDNPSAIAIGQNEFIKTWGERPLVDYWRVSQKIQQLSANQSNIENVESEEENNANEAIAEIDVEQEALQLYSQLPLSAEAQQTALDEIELAYYNLGNIYSLALEEKENAAETFVILLNRFPNTIHEPEVLYQLYLIYKAQPSDMYLKYKSDLLSKYPKSKFAKLVENPNYTEENNATAEKQKELYKTAYLMYDTGAYEETIELIDNIIRETEETYFTSHLDLLRIMSIGKIEDISRYQFELSQFIERYPDSKLLDFATNLLEASRNFQEKSKRAKGVAYIPYFEQQHYFVIVYPSGKSVDGFFAALENFNDNHEFLDIKTSNLILNDEYTMILVTEFRDNVQALEYMDEFLENQELNNVMPNFNLVKFVISKDNFNIFYQTKALTEYLSFFDKFY